jgi:hypothetical protein
MKRVVEVHVCDGCGARDYSPSRSARRSTPPCTMRTSLTSAASSFAARARALKGANCAGNLPEGVKQKKRGRKATEAPAAEPAAA